MKYRKRTLKCLNGQIDIHVYSYSLFSLMNENSKLIQAFVVLIFLECKERTLMTALVVKHWHTFHLNECLFFLFHTGKLKFPYYFSLMS